MLYNEATAFAQLNRMTERSFNTAINNIWWIWAYLVVRSDNVSTIFPQ
jgi:hypothetical protein